MIGGTDFGGLELITTAVLMLNHQRRIVYANPAAEHLLALSRRQLVGLQLSQVFRDSDRLS
ncbi:MAG: PAS domain-containing protein, partial [Burkholderiales bacterium]